VGIAMIQLGPNSLFVPTPGTTRRVSCNFRGGRGTTTRYATQIMRIGSTSARLFLVSFFLFGVVGCYPIPKEFPKNDLVGVYVLRYSFGVEELRINPDGSYVQSFTGKYKAENSGKWQQDKTHLLLVDALVLTDPFGKTLENPAKGNIGLGTAWYFGRFVLDANPDQGFMYEKKN
jgi:hypothetical protein